MKRLTLRGRQQRGYEKSVPLESVDSLRFYDAVQVVSDTLGYAKSDILGPRRYRHLFVARCMVSALVRSDMYAMSYESIGKRLGDRDHTTIMHALERHEWMMESDSAYRELYGACEDIFLQRIGKFTGEGDGRISAPAKPEFYITVNP